MSASADLTLDAAAEASLVTELIQCVIGREARPSGWDRDVRWKGRAAMETDKSPHLPRRIGRRDVADRPAVSPHRGMVIEPPTRVTPADTLHRRSSSDPIRDVVGLARATSEDVDRSIHASRRGAPCDAGAGAPDARPDAPPPPRRGPVRLGARPPPRDPVRLRPVPPPVPGAGGDRAPRGGADPARRDRDPVRGAPRPVGRRGAGRSAGDAPGDEPGVRRRAAAADGRGRDRTPRRRPRRVVHAGDRARRRRDRRGERGGARVPSPPRRALAPEPDGGLDDVHGRDVASSRCRGATRERGRDEPDPRRAGVPPAARSRGPCPTSATGSR